MVFDIHHAFVPSMSVSYGESPDFGQVCGKRPARFFEHYSSRGACVCDLQSAVRIGKKGAHVAVRSVSLQNVQNRRSQSSASSGSISLPIQPPNPRDIRSEVVLVIPGTPAHLHARKMYPEQSRPLSRSSAPPHVYFGCLEIMKLSCSLTDSLRCSQGPKLQVQQRMAPITRTTADIRMAEDVGSFPIPSIQSSGVMKFTKSIPPLSVIRPSKTAVSRMTTYRRSAKGSCGIIH